MSCFSVGGEHKEHDGPLPKLLKLLKKPTLENLASSRV
jgi:hypothetical protein